MIDIPLIVYILSGIVVILIIWIIRLELKFKKLLFGDSTSVEQSMHSIKKELAVLDGFKRQSSEYLQQVEERLRQSIRGVEAIRFNPFKGTGVGGNQSFAVAFLSERGDGVVLSTLHSRDRISVFSKPIKHFNSEFELSTEEKSVIEKSRNSFSRKG